MHKLTPLPMATFAAALAVAYAAPAAADADYGGTVARFDDAPNVDGRIAEGEWRGAIATRGFQGIKGGRLLDPRRGGSYFGFGEKRLYFAVMSALPPTDELVTKKKYRESGLVFDDSIEIWIDPGRTASKAGEGAYFSMQANAIGTVKDVKHAPSAGVPDKGWNADWTVGTKLHKDKGVWVIELSAPAEDFGLEPGELAGNTIGVLIARNFKNPWAQVTWFPHRGRFSGRARYPAIRLTERAPAVRVRSLGDEFFEGHIDLRAEIFNPGPARTARVRLKASSSDMPRIEDTTTLELPANGSNTYRFSASRFHADAKHQLTLEVAGVESGERYFRWRIHRWTKPADDPWTVETGPKPEKAVRLAYYPSYGKIKVRVAKEHLAEGHRDAGRAEITVFGPGGDSIATHGMALGEGATQGTFAVGDLDEGRYTARIDLEGRKKPFERAFRREYFAFENNRLGLTKKVYPPFEPMRVEGHTVRVVQRRYEKTGLGLWRSVESVGEELLARPVALVANGDRLEGEGGFRKRADHQVVYAGSASHPAVAVETRTITEYDGAMRVELTLKPGAKKRELESLTLEVPIEDEHAPLWHVTSTTLRSNPAGKTPAGTGRVWGSEEYPSAEWYGNFKPYIWLGAEKRGLCFFADNDRNWVLDRDPKTGEFDSCITLHRKDGVVTMRVHLVQKPITLEAERKIVFGLMASPAKPMPENWRKLQVERQYKDYPSSHRMGAQYWGSPTVMYSAYPVNGDMSILTKMQEARLTGRVPHEDRWIDRWIQRNFPDGKVGDKAKKSIETLRSLASNAIGQGAGHEYFTVYWEEFHRTLPHSHPEVRVFGNEWSGGFGKGGVHALPPSYRDFAAWYGAEFLRRGIGLYFDNTFPKRTKDTLTTAAYELPNGRIQPSANMWAHRAYLKRIWILHQQLAPAEGKPMMVLHTTNSHILPYMGFNQMNLGLEWLYGPEPQQSKFSPAMLRAQTLGRQTGNIPAALSKVKNAASEKQRRKAHRSRFGMMMVHEIRPGRVGKIENRLYDILYDAGYGLEATNHYNYWHEDDPTKPSDDRIKTLTFTHGGKAMVLLCTWNPEAAEATIRFDTNTLGFTPKRAVDAESGKPLEWKNGRLRMELSGYATRIVRLQ